MLIAHPDMPQATLPPLVEQIPAVVFRLSHNGECWKTLYVTRNISIYGYDAEEFLSNTLSWTDLVHPDDKVLLSKTINDYEAHNINSFKLYYRLITKNGDAVPVTEYNTVNRDQDGSIICYDTVIVSNTQDEASRRLIDAHYRQQVVLNDILMSLHDSDLNHALQIILDRTGAYLDTSRALLFKDSPDHQTCKIVYEWCNKDIKSVKALDYVITYGTSMPEIYVALQGTGNLLINFGEIPENCREEFDAEGLVASAIFAVYLEGDHYGFVCFDDCVVERIWDEDTARFLKNIANLISTVLARQQTAHKLEQNRKTYEAVLNNVDSYIFVIDGETEQILFANNAFKHAFGENCEGKRADSYLSLNAVPLPAAETSGKEYHAPDYPEIYCGRSGEWLAVSVEEILWMDGRTAHLYNCYDITAKKLFADTLEEKIEERTRELVAMTKEAQLAREKAEDAMMIKSRFLANISHEIRTPMNAILGLSELLANAELNETYREHARNIRNSSSVLLDIINNVLDIAKIEDGSLSLVNVHFRLHKLLDSVSAMIKNLAERKGITYTCSVKENTPEHFFGDDIRLSQVLLNILGNAVKFTESGGVNLEVAIKDGNLLFTIADSGIGIRQEDYGTIFEAFSQTDIHKNRNLQGTGLGLPICKNLVELMGGSLTFNSVYGEGSTFTISIPAVPGDCDQVRPDQQTEKKLFLPKVRILVVDDIDINLYVAQAMLEDYGIQTTLATSGEEALRLVQASDFDLVFMDHMMPGMDGGETARAIRQLGAGYSSLPIVMLTANVVAESWEDYAKEGMDDFLAKPIEPERLIAILEKWIPEDKKTG